MKRHALIPLLVCLLLNTAAAETAVSVTAAPRQANHTTPSAERLRAHAVLLSEQAQSYAEHEQAFYAWQAVIRHNPNDADALFNAAYQAQKAYKQGNRLQQSAWLPHIKQGYRQVLVLNPDNYHAMNNWGVALDDEAWVLGQNNPFNEEAWDKWKKAHRQYSKALREDFSQPLNNWISSLIQIHHALKHSQSNQAKAANVLAQVKLIEAQKLAEGFIQNYPQHAAELAYNLACVYALSGSSADKVVEQLKLSASGGKLPSKNHIEQDKDLDTIRHSPAFQNWFKQTFPEYS